MDDDSKMLKSSLPASWWATALVVVVAAIALAILTGSLISGLW